MFRLGSATGVNWRRGIAVFGLTAVALIALSACGGSGSSSSNLSSESGESHAKSSSGAANAADTSSSEDSESITFVSPVPIGDSSNAPYFIAAELFAPENGVEVSFTTNLEAAGGTKMLMAEQGDVFIASPPVMAVSADAKLPVKYFRDDLVRYIFGFGVAADSPIHSIKELKGKTIAIQDAGWSVIWDPILRAAGLKPDEYTYKVTGVGRWQALAGGEVDAVATWDMDALTPGFQNIENVRFLKARDEFPAASKWISNGEMVRTSDLEEHKPWLVGFGKAVSETTVFIKANPECAAEVALRRLPKGSYTKAQLTEELETQAELMEDPATEAHGLGYTDPEGLQLMMKDFSEAGVTKEEVSAEAVSDNSLLPEINDFDHAAVIKKAKECQIN